jgi:hypothetical protein
MNPTITKAEMARVLNVSRARITQLTQLGLPTCDDGRLGTVEALRWIIRNVMPPVEGGGIAREARLLLWELTGEYK